MNYDRKFYMDTENTLVKIQIHKFIDENAIASIADFYQILYYRFKEQLQQEKEEKENNER